MVSMMAAVGRYVYLFLMLIFVGTGAFICHRRQDPRRCGDMYGYQTAVIVAMNLLSFVILLCRSLEKGTLVQFLPYFGLYVIVLVLVYVDGIHICRSTSRLLWNCVLLLLSLGIVVLWRLDEQSAIRQICWLGISLVVLLVIQLFFYQKWIWKIPAGLFLMVGMGLIILPFFFTLAAGGALNWVSIGPIQFQPSEIAKICWTFFLAFLYAKEENKLARVLAGGIACGFMALVLLKQNDLGALLIFGVVFWLMTYQYTRRSFVLWGGILGIFVAAVGAYYLVGHVRVRFDAWLNPWADVTGGGYQIAQSLFAIAGGGWLGTGLYQGQVGYIPARTTDMIFAVVGEEFGGLFSMLLVGVYLLMFLVILQQAEKQKAKNKGELLMAFAILWGFQTFLIIAGNIKLLPLTGVTLPLISYGGSSLLSSLAIVGILQSVIRTGNSGKGGKNGKRQKGNTSARVDIQEPFQFEDPI